ncbi:hypothetical protein PSMK_08360 [Phycisphaera mikurensis NBRC 102666]|uniref:Uncharacterized protein n=2 Tax=Phycisphaera TaxID=666508 RepID=I0ICK7_PHYMF|nr:hypothetical protein PSMK_08360 [Phycisphaera mikurensis NBRC 102666]
MLGDNGIVCEALREDPLPEAYTGSDDEVGSAIDSALDVSSTHVDVDEIARRYGGQSVRVIDRDKIRKRVMEVVTTAIKKSLPASTSADTSARDETLERVEEAIKKVFGNNANLTSEVPAPAAAEPAPAPAPAPGPRPVPTAAVAAGAGVAEGTPFAENKFQLISEALGRIERNMNVVVAAAKRGGIGGGGGGGRGADHSANVGRHLKTVRNPENDKVLLQIFETNVKMQKKVAEKAAGGGDG